MQEKTKTFKVYALINATAVLCAFICAAALIGVSAAKHDDAIIKCQVGNPGLNRIIEPARGPSSFLQSAPSVSLPNISPSSLLHITLTCVQTDFFTPTANATGTGIGQNTIDDAQNSTLQEQGKILCNPFAWADIGIMGGLWLLLLLTQLYFIL